MYQALRDVVIMRQQHAMSAFAVGVVADLDFVGESVSKHKCSALGTSEAFEQNCSVYKIGKVVDCATWPGLPCHVKDATVAFKRMGDMGKLPTSAWLRVWKDGGIARALAEACDRETSPTKRAALLVERFAEVHRVGRKLATMFVSALSTPALAPGLTPWFPTIDGNDLVVVDTNVARAVDTLRKPYTSKTYEDRALWVQDKARTIDLTAYRADVPKFSPRLVQQALYAFCSKSNRMAQGDSCAGKQTACESCAPEICPFVDRG